jgi:ferrous iron transport protein A
MTLEYIKKGQRFKVDKIKDDSLKSQAIRLGVYEGATLSCKEKIPFGPIILRNRFQEIAIGRNLANKIDIDLEEGA